jgi:hypothetical protein
LAQAVLLAQFHQALLAGKVAIPFLAPLHQLVVDMVITEKAETDKLVDLAVEVLDKVVLTRVDLEQQIKVLQVARQIQQGQHILVVAVEVLV